MGVSENAVTGITETLPEESQTTIADTSVSENTNTDIPVESEPEIGEVSSGSASPEEIVKELLSSESEYSDTTVTADNTEIVALLEQIYASELKQEQQNEASISILLFFAIGVSLYFIYRFLKIFF